MITTGHCSIWPWLLTSGRTINCFFSNYKLLPTVTLHNMCHTLSRLYYLKNHLNTKSPLYMSTCQCYGKDKCWNQNIKSTEFKFCHSMPMGCCLLYGHHLNLNEQIWLSGYCQEPSHSTDVEKGPSKTEGWRKQRDRHEHNPKPLTR